MKLLNFLRGEAFARGIHPPQHKHTARTPIRRMPYPSQVTVPLLQHIGKPPQAIVRVGQEVVRGQPIARSDDWLSVPHHAPVTGVGWSRYNHRITTIDASGKAAFWTSPFDEPWKQGDDTQ